MNFDELLSEVEGAIHGSTTSKQSTWQHASNSSTSSSYRPSSSQSTTVCAAATRRKNELDDLLDMVADEDTNHHRSSHASKPAPVHPRSAYSVDSSSATKITPPGGSKKCAQLLLSGEAAKRGLNTAFNASNTCSNLRCNECDFTVVQFPGKKWSVSADYMFFRENVPNESKLRAKMEFAPDFTAYACQCKWLSVDTATRVDSTRVKWSCAGH